MYVCTTTINIEMDFISLGQHLVLLGRTHGWTLGSILLIGDVWFASTKYYVVIIPELVFSFRYYYTNSILFLAMLFKYSVFFFSIFFPAAQDAVPGNKDHFDIDSSTSTYIHASKFPQFQYYKVCNIFSHWIDVIFYEPCSGNETGTFCICYLTSWPFSSPYLAYTRKLDRGSRRRLLSSMAINGWNEIWSHLYWVGRSTNSWAPAPCRRRRQKFIFTYWCINKNLFPETS